VCAVRADPVATAFLLVEVSRRGEPVWAVKWRSADGSRPKRRLGRVAWVQLDAAGGWRPRAGRPRDGELTEFQARRLVPDLVRKAEAELAVRAAPPPPAPATFRELGHVWLAHLEHVKDVKPTTLRDYRSLLAEPDVAYRRGNGRTLGRIMRALGDLPASDVSADHVEKLLRSMDGQAVARRTINRYRQTLHAIFAFGMRRDQRARWRLESNPVADVDRRREEPPGHLEVFTVEQVEALARAAETGSWRTPHDYATPNSDHLRRDEDQQLADLLRIAAYTGVRRGELVTLRWDDVRWADRVLIVRRALSGGIETTTKSRRIRYVPLGDQALAALDRLSRRDNFTGPDDYVFANVAGDRLDDSALRRRYLACRDAAGLPPLRFHDLRHTAGSLLVRVLDPVTVKDIMGHADLATTERYLHAVRATRLADKVTLAFADPSASAGSNAAVGT
jgi:integrase